MWKLLNGGTIKLGFHDFVIYDNYMWFSDIDRNYICKSCLDSGRTEVIGRFQEKNISELYGSTLLYQDKIFFVPYRADRLALYDTKYDKIDAIDLMLDSEIKSFWKFGVSFILNTKLYMIGFSYPAIIQVDLKNYEVRQYTEWYEACREYIKPYETIFSQNFYRDKEDIYLVFAKKPMFLKFNLLNGSWEWIESKIKDNIFSFAVQDNCFYGGEKDIGRMFKYNILSGKMQYLCEYEDDVLPIKTGIFKIRVFNGTIFVVPKQENRILYLTKQDKFREIRFNDSFIDDSQSITVFKMSDNKITYFDNSCKALFQFGIDDYMICRRDMVIGKEGFYSYLYSGNIEFYENKYLNLEFLTELCIYGSTKK